MDLFRLVDNLMRLQAPKASGSSMGLIILKLSGLRSIMLFCSWPIPRNSMTQQMPYLNAGSDVLHTCILRRGHVP